MIYKTLYNDNSKELISYELVNEKHLNETISGFDFDGYYFINQNGYYFLSYNEKLPKHIYAVLLDLDNLDKCKIDYYHEDFIKIKRIIDRDTKLNYILSNEKLDTI